MQSDFRSVRDWLPIFLIAVLPACGGCDSAQQNADVPPVRTATVDSSSNSDKSATATGSPQSAKSTADAAASGSGKISESLQQAFDGMKFYVPSSWKQLPLSQMQMGIVAAKFGLPQIGEDISLTLSTSGGSIEDNIQRWEGQFRDGEPLTRETVSIDGKEATIVRLQGTFSAGFGRPPEKDWRMIGVIIPMSQHNYFIKLTGPAQEVSEAESEFLEFCRSARRE